MCDADAQAVVDGPGIRSQPAVSRRTMLLAAGAALGMAAVGRDALSPSSSATAAGTYLRPCGDVRISSSWQGHKNRNPPSGEPGTDYAVNVGTAIRAATDGVILDRKDSPSTATGRYIALRGDDGNYLRYLHLLSSAVAVGTRVKRGQVIAYSGASGFGREAGYGPHVHVSLWVGGTPTQQGYTRSVDFENYVASGTTQPAEPVKYYVTQYDGTVWAVTPTSIVALSWSQWQAAGFPEPAPAPTDYVRYPWSTTISAVTIFGTDPSRWIWRHVTIDEWNRAGRPAARTAGWIKDSIYYQWAGSDQIIVQDVGGVRHVLTYEEWRASGFQPFERRSGQGYVKLSWDGNIAFLTDFAAGKGEPIDYRQWEAAGFPKPTVATRFPGDQVYRFNGEDTIWYAGPTVNRTISYPEWGIIGYPTPPVRRIGPIAPYTCPAWAQIKGKAGVYYLPGARGYDATHPDECFRTENAAIKAGYRRAPA